MTMKKIVWALVVAMVATPAYAADYVIDPSHSSVAFKVRHLAISSVPGKFADFKGTFSFDPKSPATSKANAEIVAGSITTGENKRDDHLKSPDFLDAASYGTLTFASSKIENVSGSEFDAHGNLTIHGVTRPVVLHVTYGGSATDPWGKERAAFVATTKISRKDFGLTWNKLLETGALVVGDEVAITLEIEGVKA